MRGRGETPCSHGQGGSGVLGSVAGTPSIPTLQAELQSSAPRFTWGVDKGTRSVVFFSWECVVGFILPGSHSGWIHCGTSSPSPEWNGNGLGQAGPGEGEDVFPEVLLWDDPRPWLGWWDHVKLPQRLFLCGFLALFFLSIHFFPSMDSKSNFQFHIKLKST